MKPYLTYTLINLRLTWRDKMVLFFNYLFPLVFFFMFAQLSNAEQGGAINQVYAAVIVIGVLGNGFFGGGIRAVVEREANILRRFKVAPISPGPILVSAMIVGVVSFLPSALFMFGIAWWKYGMAIPPNWLSALLMITLGTLAFRAMGQIIASVANSSAESHLIIQSLYFPMMFLSGATLPLSMFPDWLKIATQFIPATYLFSGIQSILVRGESLLDNWTSVAALILTTVLCLFISMKLFRWEKGEKLKPSAKLWVLGVMAPFFLAGAWQAYSRDNLKKALEVNRELRRSRTLLIRDARVFVGDGESLDRASVLIREGKIAEIYPGAAPDPEGLRAQPIDGSGKTLLPALIDAHVWLSVPGGIYEKPEDYVKPGAAGRALAAYLFSGVASVLSAADAVDRVREDGRRIASGERLGAELFYSGPLVTAKGGSGTETFQSVPANVRTMIETQFTRMPATPDEARAVVRELKKQGVTAVKAALDAGTSGSLVNRMDPSVLKALAEESAAQGLALLVQTGDARDVLDAVNAGAKVIVNGSARDRIPDETFARMVKLGVWYMPLLAPHEGRTGNVELLERSLVQQAAPADLLAATKKKLAGLATGSVDLALERPIDNLRRAYAAGISVVAGSGGGNFLVLHGPGIHRELQLWMKAGLPAHAALQAATFDAARLLGVEKRIGAIRKGYEATVLLVNGNPMQQIEATEAISLVIYKGEQVSRSELFEQEQ